MLKLYDYFRSSASFRVRIALNLKGISYEALPIHLVKAGGEQFSPQYQKINPLSLVPSLQDENKILTQSLAIIEYLEEAYPQVPLLPADIYQKALVRSFALTIIADVHPLNNLRVLNYLLKEFEITDAQKLTWYHHWLRKGFTALEKQLAGQKSAYCFGDAVTLADICLVPQMYNAQRFHFDLSAFPTLTRINENCLKIPAFYAARPIEEEN